MALNPNPSQQSLQQCAARMFDSSNDAQRVILVGGEGITLNADVKMPEVLTTQVVVKEVQIVEVPTIVKEIEIQYIDRPVFIEKIEIREISVPVITHEIQVVTIEKPVVTTVYKTIEVPVVVEKLAPAEFPIWAKAILAVQGGCAVLQLVSHFLK
jgi:hypothetical protein